MEQLGVPGLFCFANSIQLARTGFFMTKSSSTLLFFLLLVQQISTGQIPILSVTNSEGFAEAIVATSIQVSCEDSIHGFSFGLTHDSAILSIPGPNSIRQSSLLTSLNNGAGPDFFNSNIFPSNGNGLTIACVTDLFAPFDLIPPTPGASLLEIDYLIATDAPVGTVTPIDFTDLLGTPPVQTVMVLQLQEIAPTILGGTVTVTEPLFIRGDLDQSGGLSLIDGVLLLYRVSGLEPPGTCRDSDDINNDGLLTIGDAVYLFQYLFINGPAIPAPTILCGPDQGTEDTLDCVDYFGCE